MKFTRKQVRWVASYYTGRKKSFYFKISEHSNKLYDGKFYVVVIHQTLDIRYNSLWEKIVLNTLEEAIEFCENFVYTNYACVGKDVTL